MHDSRRDIDDGIDCRLYVVGARIVHVVVVTQDEATRVVAGDERRWDAFTYCSTKVSFYADKPLYTNHLIPSETTALMLVAGERLSLDLAPI